MQTIYAHVKVIEAKAVPGTRKMAALHVVVQEKGAMPTNGQSIALTEPGQVYLVEKYGPQVGNACSITVHNVPDPAALVNKTFAVELA